MVLETGPWAKKKRCQTLIAILRKCTNIDNTNRVVSRRASIAVNKHLSEDAFVFFFSK